MKKTSCFICGLLLGFIVGLVLSSPQSCSQHRTEVVRDTVIDTIPYYMPVPKDSIVIRYQTVKLPVKKDTDSTEFYAHDSTENIRDSATVEIPITQKHYTDSAYDAWVSGYLPQLDSIKVYQPNVTNTIYIKPKPQRWNIGITGGYGITPKGFQPYIGIGVTYNILNR